MFMEALEIAASSNAGNFLNSEESPPWKSRPMPQFGWLERGLWPLATSQPGYQNSLHLFWRTWAAFVALAIHTQFCTRTNEYSRPA